LGLIGNPPCGAIFLNNAWGREQSAKSRAQSAERRELSMEQDFGKYVKRLADAWEHREENGKFL